jgi:hypothetical protein
MIETRLIKKDLKSSQDGGIGEDGLE